MALKMRLVLTACALLVLSTSCMSNVVTLEKRMSLGANGGTNCATCSLTLGLIYQLSDIYNETVTKAMERLCSFMPSEFKQPCDVVVDFLTPFIIELVTKEESPDTVCIALGFCTTDPGHQTCRIWPKPRMEFDSAVKRRRKIVQMLAHSRPMDPSICKLPGVKEICAYIDRTFGHHLPSFDVDSDGFSNVQTMRGFSWRGADCNDDRNDIHPGAKPVQSDVMLDYNCNGIYGSDPVSTRPYEDVFCAGTEPRGIAVLGDSVGAHFHLPEEWFDSRKLSPKVFENAPFIIENEIDWPELSTFTGYMNNSWPSVIHGTVDSIYKRLLERNRCNHRDYQNIAANGMASDDMTKFVTRYPFYFCHRDCTKTEQHIPQPLMNQLWRTDWNGLTASKASTLPTELDPAPHKCSLRRDKHKDYPMFVIYSLIGNDVCNGHPDTFARMTTPKEMHDNTIKTLHYLDKVLPANSSVLMTGLAEGRILYDSLHNRIHPIGRLHNDVTYPDFYDYFNCLEISPCVGWMNTNETVRNMTTARANQLTAVLRDIAKHNASMFTNFKLYFMNCPLDMAFDYWAKHGGQSWELIEPVDGFHNNQYGQALTAQLAWEYLEKNHPEILGNINPNNAEIKKIFGNQGGYVN